MTERNVHDTERDGARTTERESGRIPVVRHDTAGDDVRGTVAEPSKAAADVREPSDERVSLLPDERLHQFRLRWEEVQTGFVDRPREAVQEAHDLVDSLVKDLSQSFMSERSRLEASRGPNGEASTEDLRQALRRYRSFFNRLLET